jgi:hypothetical protein
MEHVANIQTIFFIVLDANSRMFGVSSKSMYYRYIQTDTFELLHPQCSFFLTGQYLVRTGTTYHQQIIGYEDELSSAKPPSLHFMLFSFKSFPLGC